MALKCDNCGKELINSKGFCPYCGTKINDNSKKIFSCPACKVLVDYSSDFCANCGFKITKDLNYVINETNSKSCPNCNNKNNIDAEFCGKCGKSLPLVSNLEIIPCPDCKSQVRDDVNFCRFCGYDFNKGKKSFFSKKPQIFARYCQNCGNEVRGNELHYCNNCGTKVPLNKEDVSNHFQLHEDYMIIFINKLIVPLSNEYKVNFRKTTIKDYFDLTKEQELHIIYLVNKKIKENPDDDIVQYFKSTLEETKNNYKNIEEAIFNKVKKKIAESFYGRGLYVSEVRTIRGDYYDTIETPIIQNKHGGLTKGAATLGFGLIGLAATSGVKQTTKTRQVLNKGSYLHRSVDVSDKYIVVKSYTDDSNHEGFLSDKGDIVKNVIYWKDVNLYDHERYIILNNGEAFKIPQFKLKYRITKAIELVLNTGVAEIDDEFEKKYYNDIFSKASDFITSLINETIDKNKKIENQKQKNDLQEENTSNRGMIECPNCSKLNDNNNKFCGECGSKLEIANYCPNCNKTYTTGEKFCTECGTKLTTKN